MEVRNAGQKEKLLDQEPEDLRGPEEEGHAEEPGGRHQQRPGQEEKEEVAPLAVISPAPVRQWRPEWIPAYLSNGLIGLRAGPIPQIEGLCIVGGLAAVDPVEKGEGFAPGPYPSGGVIQLHGPQRSPAPPHAPPLRPRG